MISKYIYSFILALVVVCSILSMLPFTTHSQVQAGTTMEETWINEFVLEASSDQFYRIDAELKSELEKGIRFVGSGILQGRTAKVEITSQDVSWTVGKTRYTATGARMVTHILSEARNNDAGTGDIHIELP